MDNIQEYLNKINENISPITILGLSDIAKISLISKTQKAIKKPILLVTYNELTAQNLHQNIKKLNQNAIYIPKKDIITYEYDAQSMDILFNRIEGIKKLLLKDAEITIISIETLLEPIMSIKTMQNSILKLEVQNEYNLEEIKQKLVSLGYERCDLVEGKGTFSIRGDILDIAENSKKGIRVEFFGDEIDQIRYFDIQNQRSIENINQIEIYPLTEEIEKEPKGSLLEYIQKDTIIAFDEISKIILREKNIQKDNELLIKDLIERQRQVPYILENMLSLEKQLEISKRYQIIYLEMQDISRDKENAILVEPSEIKEIEKEFEEATKHIKENQIYKPRKRHSSEFREAEKITFSDLKIGDYVVHRTNGIGQYIGVNTIKTERYYKRLYKNKIHRR